MKKMTLALFAVFLLFLLAACGDAIEEETAAPPETANAETDDFALDEEPGEEADAGSAADVLYDDEAMLPEDCFPGEAYDPEEQVCYIECDTEEECLAKEEEIYGNLDEYLDTEFSGPAGRPPADSGEAPAAGEEQPIARYNVDDTLEIALLEKDDSVTNPDYADPNRHEEIWGAVRYLLPNDVLREDVGRFFIFTDGPDGTLAYVEQLPDDLNTWQFGVDIEDARDMYTKDFVHTLIHEFGHVATLRNNQVPPDTSRPSPPGDEEFVEPSPVELSCATFYTGEGCSNPDSYINLFFARFWSDIYEENLAGSNEAETQEEMDEFAAEFYDEYSDRFLSEYAATNPGEDIAESFTFFVLQEKPDGDTIAEQKILFFYEFEPLVKMRTQMRGQLARLNK